MDRKIFLKLVGPLGAAAVLGIPFTRKVEAMNDSLTNAALAGEKNFTDWLAKFGKRGYVGEVGVALNRSGYTDQDQWGGLFNAWMSAADTAGIWVNGQGISERYSLWRDGYYFGSLHACKPFGPQALSSPTANGLVFEPHSYGGKGIWGYNFEGAQTPVSGGSGAAFSNSNPGTYGQDYWYPSDGPTPVDPDTGMNSWQYLASRPWNGCSRIHRVGFRWERIQPTLFANLNGTELAHMKKCVANAKAAGLKVILDVHNYGGYVFSDGRQPLNSSRLPASALVDLWNRLSYQFKSDTTVFGYDIMNEPFNQGGIQSSSGMSDVKTWETITQQVVNQIRKQGSTQWIMVPAYCGAETMSSTHPLPWISDTANKYAYTAHQYFDQARYGNLPDGKNGRPAIADPDTGRTYAFESGTGGGQYKHSYNSDNVLANYRASR